jgi:membrane-associated phospholipid phosphatase
MSLVIDLPKPSKFSTTVKILLFLLAAGCFTAFALKAKNGATNTDVHIMNYIHSFSSPYLNDSLPVLTDAGKSTTVVIIGLIVSAVLLYMRKYYSAAFVLISICGTLAIGIALKLVIVRNRPELWTPLIQEIGYSFPSGHALASSVLGLVLIIIAWSSRWRWYVTILASLYVVFVGFSRFYLGVHYPSDVLAAWCVSLMWVIIVKTIIDIIWYRRTEEKLHEQS